MIDGSPSRSICGHLHQLEVCKLLQYGDQVVYPEGLNGGLEPLQPSLLGPLWVLDALGKPACEPSFLLVDLSQVTLGDHMPKAPATCRTLTLTSSSHLAMEHPPNTDSHISMTAEVQELLSHAMLDTSSQVSGDSTQKRPTSMALGAPPSARAEDSSKAVATSPLVLPQVAVPDDTVTSGHSSPTTLIAETPEAASIPTAPPSKTPSGADMGVLSDEVLQLQREMNRAMGHLLMTRVSIDTHHRKQVLNFEMAIQQSHSNSMQCLEREAMEEEERGHLSFLATCGVALQACPPEAHGVLLCPLQLLMGNMSLATLLAIPPQASTAREEPTPVISHPTTLVVPIPSSGIKWWCHSPN